MIIRKTSDSRYVYGNLLENFFQHDLMYANKYLQKRTYTDKALRGKSLKVVTDQGLDRYQKGFKLYIKFIDTS